MMLQSVVFLVVVLVFFVTSHFISEERNREKKAHFYFGRSLMTYREGDYYTSINYLKKAMIIPSSQYINESEATLNLKVLDLTDLVMLQLNIDSSGVTLNLRRFLSRVKGVELYNIDSFEQMNRLYDQLMSKEELDQAMLTHISFSHLKDDLNFQLKDEVALKKKAIQVGN